MPGGPGCGVGLGAGEFGEPGLLGSGEGKLGDPGVFGSGEGRLGEPGVFGCGLGIFGGGPGIVGGFWASARHAPKKIVNAVFIELHKNERANVITRPFALSPNYRPFEP